LPPPLRYQLLLDAGRRKTRSHEEKRKLLKIRSRKRSNITTVTVKDYYSKKDIDALKAFYVIWGDVYGPMGNEPIPFSTEAAAKTFLQEHHGKKILRFKDITLKLLHSLDNPE